MNMYMKIQGRTNMCDKKFMKNRKRDTANLIQQLSLNIGQFLLVLDIVLLIIHILLEAVYIGTDVRIMIAAGLFSIIFYAVMFVLVRLKRYKLYVVLTYIEVLTHCILATYCMGYSCGFQHWAITFMCASFFPLYALNDVTRLKKSSASLTFCVGLVYLGLHFFYSIGIIPNEVPYVSHRIEMALSTFNSLVLAIGVFFFTYLFTSRITSVESSYRYQARHDQLTGLYNRYALHEFISDKMNEQNLKSGDFSIAIADIDFFKKVNDTYGHEMGDSVLYIVSENFLAHTDSVCKVGRWGGEEFLFVIMEKDSENKIHEKMESVREDIENLKIPYKNSFIKLTISAGTTSYQSGDNMDTLLQRADDNLYTAKENGRNCVVS